MLPTPPFRLATCLLKFHLQNLHVPQTPATTAALPQAIPLGIAGRRFLCRIQQWRVGFAMPKVIGHAVEDLNTGVTSAKLLRFAWEVLGLAAVRGIFLFLTRWVVIGISRDIEFDLRNDLFAHLETLSYSYYQRIRTGDIMARMTNDLNAVRMLMGPAIMYSANTLVFTAAALSFMMRISPKLTFYAFLPLPVVSVVDSVFWPPHSRTLRKNSGDVLGYLRTGPGKFFRGTRHSRLRAGRSGDQIF